MSDTQELRTFDSFEPGTLIGETELQLDDTLLSSWDGIGQGRTGDHLPPGLLVALLMRGYGQVVDRRPPGNVHAGLEMDFLDDRLDGDRLRVTVRCAGKELRKGRRWVHFESEQFCGNRCLARSRLTLLWAR